jgi:hypothetical protein
LEQNNKTTRTLLFVLQGVGAVFVGVFLAAYLGGMLMHPSTTVLHSEPAFRFPLMIFGVAFLVLTIVIVVVAAMLKKK